ncbi:ATP-binding protein, partial [Escherichia coli]|uniref:ATP-binding protein n=1 Tax=Escherichia coli TaxID=562 RepID=UPI0021E0E10F
IIMPKAKAKEILFDVKIPKKFPKAMLDKRYTFMVIENLLTNAIKYTPEKGRVSLSVEIIGKSIHCVVSDSGCGIPE